MNIAPRWLALIVLLLVVPLGSACRAVLGLSSAELIEPDAGSGGSVTTTTTTAAPTCFDGIQNQDETDVDCGGMICKPCAFAKKCKVNGDCASAYCNCGGGQPCNAGVCDAYTLASGQGSAYGIAVQGTSVFWTDVGNGTVMKGAVGGGPPYTLASGQVSPKAIAVDATSVYWTAFDGVMKCPIDGNVDGGVPGLLAPGDAVGMALYGTSLLWTNVTAGAVEKTPVGGGPPFTLESGQDSPSGIVVDTTSVYWTTFDKVMKAPVGGGAATPLASGQASPKAMALDATSAYWATVGGVMSVPIGGGASPVTVATGAPIGLAVDATDVYWTDASAGTVMKAPIGGGPATMLASGQPTPTGIAVDGTSAYWTAGAFVRKLRK